MGNYVVVIDPGHGSEAYPGGTYDGYVEKDIDLVVASVMKDRLEKYDGVTVYMTRYDDSNVELGDRAKIAKTYNADLFVSIHFNLSPGHNYYGSELWVPCQNKYYNKVYPLANEMMKNFEGMGLFNRGIKTRLNSAGTGDYYAVLKGASNYGIPSILVEHCHMDHPRDTFAIPIYDTNAYMASLNNFGVQDADAVAKYLHLKSTALGVDYSKYKLAKSNVKSAIVRPDVTAPESCEVKLVSQDAASGTVTVDIHALDSDGYIQYYQYSADGGAHWSSLQDWPRSSWNKSLANCRATIKVPTDADATILVFVYNGYDLVTAGNILTVPKVMTLSEAETGASDNDINITQISGKNVDIEATEGTYTEITYDVLKQDSPISGPGYTMGNTGMLLTLAGLLAGFAVTVSLLMHRIKASKRRRRR